MVDKVPTAAGSRKRSSRNSTETTEVKDEEELLIARDAVGWEKEADEAGRETTETKGYIKLQVNKYGS